jgi:DNA repair photolyase
MEAKEILCKTALSKSALPGLVYALNPYRGCSHACVYCYAPAILRERRKWGDFVDIKINIPEILATELKRRASGVVGLGTVTDPYQELERRYEITRKCLVLLLEKKFPICIQTKSALVARDIDLIKKFERREVGFTITTLDDAERSFYEGGSSASEKMDAISRFKAEGITVWVFLGPILPGITDKTGNIENMIAKFKELGVDYILMDRLRLKPGTWENVSTFIQSEHPELAAVYEEIFLKGGCDRYYNDVFATIEHICSESGIKIKHAFGGDAR